MQITSAIGSGRKDDEVESEAVDIFYIAQIEPLPETYAVIQCEI